MATIPVRFSTTILDEIENVYDEITRRAYEKFLTRGGAGTLDIEDWLEAERELLLKPEARLVEKRGHFIIRLDLPNVVPANVRVLVTQDDLVVQSDASYPGPRIFKIVHFPEAIDLGRVRSSWAGGRLIVVVLKAGLSAACGAGKARAASEALHTAHR
jgi:hypothetical protein